MVKRWIVGVKRFSICAMKLKDLLKKYKTQRAIALTFDYRPATISIWRKKNNIPYRAQLLIQNATGGEFRAVRARSRVQ
jgi:hypothetical protein